MATLKLSWLLVVAMPLVTGCRARPRGAPSRSAPRTHAGAERTPRDAAESSAPPRDGGSAGAWVQLVAGSSHACARSASGEVHCWGGNGAGQLGEGSRRPRSSPTRVALAGPATQVDARGARTCALLEDGSAWCWGVVGSAPDSESPPPVSAVPARVPDEVGALRSLLVGDYFVCGLRRAGGVVCWGTSDGNTVVSVALPSPVRELRRVDAHLCALLEGSPEPRCWNSADARELETSSDWTLRVRAAASGRWCTLDEEHTLRCVLSSSARLRGTEDPTEALRGGPDAPELSDDAEGVRLRGVAEVGLYSRGGCALRRGGTVSCWDRRELYDVGVTGARSLAIGEDFGCALSESGGVSCWGSDEQGQLGDGRVLSSAQFVPLAAPSEVTQVVASGSTACALAYGAAYCWGQRARLQRGRFVHSSAPAEVANLRGLTALALGGETGCVLGAGGQPHCWGRFFGLSDDWEGTLTPRPLGPAGATSIAVGGGLLCTVSGDGLVRCGGDNERGLAGGSGNFVWPPRVVPGPTGVRALTVGSGHACALAGNGAVWCWGDLEGLGARAPLRSARLVPSVAGARSLASGGSRSCALATGATWCWGVPGWIFGQLRLPLGEPAPARVEVLRGAAELGLGGRLCARYGEASLRCWSSLQPTPAEPSEELTGSDLEGSALRLGQVAVGGDFECLRTAAGRLLCRGDNRYGQLGDGAPVYRALAVALRR